MSGSIINSLASIIAFAALLLACYPVGGIRLYKSRADALLMLADKESRIYFTTCDQSSKRSSCLFAIDIGLSLEPTQCALTDLEDRPWWVAILDNPAYITTVTVLNMNQQFRAFTDALRNMSIIINDDVCFRYSSKESFMKLTFPCDTVGDRVSIKSELPQAALSICDVEVMGASLKFPTALEDNKPLLIGTCTQPTVHGDGYCTHAFDGETKGTCAVTSEGSEQFLELTLETPSVVNLIVIYTKSGGGLTKFEVTVNSRTCAEHEGAEFKSHAFACKHFGNTLRITSKLGVAMTVCEVEVLGHAAAIVDPPKYKHLGCHKDVADNRDFNMLAATTMMTPNKCQQMCRRTGLKFFGLQAGRFCWCGSSYGKHGKVLTIACQAKCEGDDSDNCGGDLMNSVYEII